MDIVNKLYRHGITICARLDKDDYDFVQSFGLKKSEFIRQAVAEKIERERVRDEKK